MPGQGISMKRQLTTNVPPRKIRYQHIVDDLQVIFEQKKAHEQDFKTVHALLARHYGLSQDTLLLQGIRRAYRQVVEGV